MKYFMLSILVLMSNAALAQAVVTPGTINQIAGPGSASVVAPGQIKKETGIPSKYTTPGQVKKEIGGQGKGNKGNQGKGHGK